MRETMMKASPGDRLVVRSLHVGEVVRDGEILEVHGPDGGPPYVVRWSDSGHESLVFPGPDAYIQHFAHEPEQEEVRG
ncbi:MAG TPA: DUF1918 domain-containing protein [Marmoricola sp.]|nr:DUF1918 domain-containing protein [Marmoricola sp.]